MALVSFLLRLAPDHSGGVVGSGGSVSYFANARLSRPLPRGLPGWSMLVNRPQSALALLAPHQGPSR